MHCEVVIRVVTPDGNQVGGAISAESVPMVADGDVNGERIAETVDRLLEEARAKMLRQFRTMRADQGKASS